MSELRTGKVIFYNEERGFGFISLDGDYTKVFFHISDVLTTNPILNINPKVTCSVRDSSRGRKAYGITVISDSNNEINLDDSNDDENIPEIVAKKYGDIR